MIWIIVLSALALYVIFIMCLLVIGSRADDRKKTLFMNNLADTSDYDVAFASSIPCNAGTYALDTNSAMLYLTR